MGPLCMRIYHCSIMHGRLEFDPHNVQEAIAAVRVICVQCFYYILKLGVLKKHLYWSSLPSIQINQCNGYFMSNKIGSGQYIDFEFCRFSGVVWNFFLLIFQFECEPV